MATWLITTFEDRTVQVLYSNPASDTINLDCGRTLEPFPIREVIGWAASEAATWDVLVIEDRAWVVFPLAVA